MKPVRVLVVDDSALMRKMIPAILNSDPEIEVAGTAMDGIFALQKIKLLHPDVITLDMDMPRMDGIETLRRITAEFGIPVIVVSSLTKKDADLTFQALEIGAFDFIMKPQDAISVHINDISRDLIAKVKEASRKPVHRMKAEAVAGTALQRKAPGTVMRSQADRVVAIGISTGGPNVLSELLPKLPKDFPAGIVIVQHMPPVFTERFAARLDASSAIEVKEAKDGDLIIPGRALIAPGGRHMKVKRLPLGTIAVLSDATPENGHRPSADVLFRSVAAEYGKKAIGLIMTGMGSDGAKGIGEIMAKGGMTIAQDEASCVVFGMPKAAIEMEHIQHIVSLEDMEDFLIRQITQKEYSYGTA